nr:MAG TPA: hypothetical protein [Caudoviricetes sp.]
MQTFCIRVHMRFYVYLYPFLCILHYYTTLYIYLVT